MSADDENLDEIEYEPEPLIKAKNPKRAGRPKLTDEERALRYQETRDKCNESRRNKRNLKNAEKLDEIVAQKINERTTKQKELDEDFERRFQERLLLLEKQREERREKDLLTEELNMLRDKLSKIDVSKKEEVDTKKEPEKKEQQRFVFC